ncbi:hypothetical protein CAC42_7274 [Sphaceloma murrayae]|uniref:Rhodopsin domain-containing protein n=1 Tax=Sphaceloma murrayae TaxID=2082308 RepID=A0A2K1QWT5_9PEZI|nr:hypothetical protein CAC42_7274 [Sphaceloma murrayae]
MRLKVNGPWGNDDWAAGVGTASAIAHTALLVRAVDEWGVDSNDSILTVELAVNALYLLTVASSRISTGLLLQRLERKHLNNKLIRIANTASVLWFMVGTIALGGYRGRRCATSFPLWCGLESVGLFLELLVIPFVIILIWDLKLALKQKMVVLLSFSTRLSTLPPVVLRLISMNRGACSNQSYGSDAFFAIMSLIAVHVSIMVATFSCVKQFLVAFDTGAFVAGTIHEHVDPGHKSYEMASQDSTRLLRPPNPTMGGRRSAGLQLRPNDAGYTVTEIESRLDQRPEEAASMASDASEQAIITKTQEWDVTEGKDVRPT